MSSGPPLSFLVQSILMMLPALLANVAGIVVASTQLTRFPRPAWFVIFGCSVNLFAYGASFGVRALLSSSGLSGLQSTTMHQAISLVASLVVACGLGLIITAAFIDRRVPQAPVFDE